MIFNIDIGVTKGVFRVEAEDEEDARDIMGGIEIKAIIRDYNELEIVDNVIRRIKKGKGGDDNERRDK